jgi:hypothetical protein
VPRLYLLVAFTASLYAAMGIRIVRLPSQRRNNLLWASGVAVICSIGMLSGLKHQRGLFADYAYRVTERGDVLLASQPAVAQGSLARVAMLPDGYQVLEDLTSLSADRDESGDRLDQLSFAAGSAQLWIEEVGRTSRIVPVHDMRGSAIEQAQSPVLSPNGQRLAYLREIHGHDRLLVRSLTGPELVDTVWTPPWMNVEEATFLPDASLILSASLENGRSQLYQLHEPMQLQPLQVGEARYPAASPDGRWLAYSLRSSGAWNLWLLDRVTGKTHRITHAACNQIEPGWEPDSTTLLYASDCGRALWFTAICRRRVIP